MNTPRCDGCGVGLALVENCLVGRDGKCPDCVRLDRFEAICQQAQKEAKELSRIFLEQLSYITRPRSL